MLIFSKQNHLVFLNRHHHFIQHILNSKKSSSHLASLNQVLNLLKLSEFLPNLKQPTLQSLVFLSSLLLMLQDFRKNKLTLFYYSCTLWNLFQLSRLQQKEDNRFHIWLFLRHFQINNLCRIPMNLEPNV